MSDNLGYYKGETCNRDGCKGIIDENDKEYYGLSGCSCHINPPCSWCTTVKEHCPECDWSKQDEIDEEEAKLPKPKITFTLPKMRTLEDLDDTKIDFIRYRSWHSGQEFRGVYPEGTKEQEVWDALKASGIRMDKYTMPKMKYFDNGKFIFTHFTD